MNELQARVARVLEKRALVLQNRYYQENLERQVQEQAQRIQELFLQGVQMLARALEAKDAYTRGHSIRVSQYAVGTARASDSTRARWTRSGWAGSCTTSARSARARPCCTSPGRSPPRSSARSREHPLLGERMLSPLARESPECSASCAPITSGSTAAASPTGSAARDPDRGADRRRGRLLRRDDHPPALPRIPLPASDARCDESRAAVGGHAQLDPEAVEAFVDAVPTGNPGSDGAVCPAPLLSPQAALRRFSARYRSTTAARRRPGGTSSTMTPRARISASASSRALSSSSAAARSNAAAGAAGRAAASASSAGSRSVTASGRWRGPQRRGVRHQRLARGPVDHVGEQHRQRALPVARGEMAERGRVVGLHQPSLRRRRAPPAPRGAPAGLAPGAT